MLVGVEWFSLEPGVVVSGRERGHGSGLCSSEFDQLHGVR